MNVMQVIAARRAVRDYLHHPVEPDVIQMLLHAAVQAPSARNRQPWRFAVVQDAECLKRYSDAAKALLLADGDRHPKVQAYRDLLTQPQFNIFYNASTLIVIGVEERGPYAEADAWLAAQNLMLAACDADLGTCCIGFALGVLNLPEVKQELHLPAGGAAIAPIIVGYPRTMPAPVPREEPQVVAWIKP